MFEKVGQIAEQAATNVSRREFLGRFGRGALAVAAAAGGILAFPAVGHAGRRTQRMCSADSFGGCQSQVEGAICIADDAFGHCVGPKPRGDKSTVTVCRCHISVRRGN